jgi:hypothetical protein
MQDAQRRGKDDAGAVGRWTAPFDIHTIGVHASLLHTGQVLLFVYPLGGHASKAALYDPVHDLVSDSKTPNHRNLFCSGHSLLPDGRVLVTGGTLWGKPHFFGTTAVDLYDPLTRQWAHGPPMAFSRWYPTNVTLPNGDVLILSGEADSLEPVEAVERYEVAAGGVTTLPASATRAIHDYPRMVLLPGGKVLLAGQEEGTWLLDPATAAWSFVGNLVDGARYEGNVVLLPGLRKVLAVGGNRADPLEPTSSLGAPTASAEILDTAQPNPAWRATSSMHFARQHANAVLLPDGTVLEVGGGQLGLYGAAVKQAELFDPATETWTVMASQHAARCYHSTALLLPDGRVLSAGMDSGRFARTAEIYSPPYLFRGPRPTITAAPGEVAYGASFDVATPQAASIHSVALLRPASVTHANNFEQRYVALEFTAGAQALTVRAPAAGDLAPPGWYMLFVVDTDGVPSVASWVHLA